MVIYLKLLAYSCVFCCLTYFTLTGGAAIYIYVSKGYFFYPQEHVIRTLVFGTISGVTITASVVFFRLLDKFKNRKTLPKDNNP